MISLQTATSLNAGSIQLRADEEEPYKYSHLLPVFSAETYPPLTKFEHTDPGSRALSHPNPRSFLDDATSIIEVTPALGTEVRGVSLAKMSDDHKDQLALEVARRGFMIFRDQEEFLDSGVENYRAFGSYFGRLHIHPTGAHPAGYPDINLIYKDPKKNLDFVQDESITSTVWHSDNSYELQPPGFTTLFLLSQPASGGDTLFTSSGAALRRLSPSFVAYLRTLKAVHSGVEQAAFSRSGRRGGVVRREPVEHVHPVIRKHPVTGEEVLFVNRQYTTKIVGLKKEESNTILTFLFDHIEKNGDNQARVRWFPNTVLMWDNRVVSHSANIDFLDSTTRRHGVRLTPQAERPLAALEGMELDA